MHTGRHSTDWAASTGLWRPLVWWFLCLLLRSVPMWQAHMNMVAIAGSVYLLDIYHMPNTTPSALDIILIDWIFSTTMCERKQCMYLNDNVTQSFRSEWEMNSMGADLGFKWSSIRLQRGWSELMGYCTLPPGVHLKLALTRLVKMNC